MVMRGLMLVSDVCETFGKTCFLLIQNGGKKLLQCTSFLFVAIVTVSVPSQDFTVSFVCIVSISTEFQFVGAASFSQQC